MKLSAPRSKRHTIAVGWGLEIVKVCQVIFTSAGGVLVTFPYHPDTAGIAARCEARPGQTRFDLKDEFSAVTSHKIKYHHPSDGNAHFSGTGIFHRIWARDATPLVTRAAPLHFFTLHLQGVERFPRTTDNQYLKPNFHLLEFQQEQPPDCLRLVGRYCTLDAAGIDASPRAVARTRRSDGRMIEHLLLAPPKKTSGAECLAVLVECVPEDPLDQGPPEGWLLSFQGGFGPGLDNDSVHSSFLVLNYPAGDVEDLPSMDRDS